MKALLGTEKMPTTMNDEQKQEMDEKALASIRLSLSNEVLREVAGEKTAAGLWLKLESLYMTKTLANRLHLKQRLFTMRMAEGTPIKSHLDTFMSIIMDLKNMEVNIDDEDQALLLLCSLPPSYKHFRETLVYGRESITLDDVKSSMFSKEIMDRELTTASTSGVKEEALYVKGKQKEKDSGKDKTKSKPKRFCTFCNKKGHNIEQCWSKKKQEKTNQKPAEASCVQSDHGYVLMATTCDPKDDWVLDSGCTYHMTANRSWFSTYTSVQGGVVQMGNNSQSETVGIGTIEFQRHDGKQVILTNVRHVPDMGKNLISLGSLEAKGFKYAAEDGTLTVRRGSEIVMTGTRSSGNIYILQGYTVISSTSATVTPTSDRTKLWHQRLGHMSEKGLNILSKRGLLGDQPIRSLEFCEHCVLGKQTRQSFGTGEHRTKGTLDYVHSDLWGPAQVQSKGGARYMLTFIDDYSKKVWIYVLRSKDEVFNHFKQWKTMIEKQTGKHIKRLRTDNGLEFCSGEFNEFCKKEGIVRHRTVRYTPQQNGVAERMNRTILERARCMLLQAGLSRDFWAEAVATAAYLINRSPSTTIDNKTPEEVWTGRPSDYSNLRVFGCPAYAHTDQGKLNPRSLKCIFLGYAVGVKGYRLWCLDTSKIIIEKNVVFNESALSSSTTDSATNSSNVDKQVELDVDTASPSNPQEHHEEEDQAEEDCIAKRRERRNIKPPSRYSDSTFAYALAIAEETGEAGEPRNYSEALTSPNSADWAAAMKEEMESLYKNQTWALVPPPNGQRIVGCKWIFRRKEGISGSSSVRYKARLVAKGFSQVEGVDFNDIFSPVVKHTSIRVLLAIVATKNLELEQLDVKTAFLHGELEEQIYMQQPEGFAEKGKEHMVCLLKKSLYGLKQSPRQWYKRFNAFITTQGFNRSKYDVCVYFKKIVDNSWVYLLLYVDDMLIAAKDIDEIKRLKVRLGKEFEMKDLGAAKKILGMEIQRDRKARRLWLSQRSYILKVLERFGMSDARSEKIPFSSHFKISSELCPETEEDHEYMSRIPYSNAVGSLMYAMICTRPDIAHAVSVVSRYMANPGKGHWQAVKWIFRYLQGTTDLSLEFGRNDDSLIGYVDADYAGDRDKRRSMTGYIFTMGRCAVSWKATLQSTVALSTTEAEYMAAAEGIKEAIWLNGLVAEISSGQKTVVIYCDSQSAIHLTKDQMHHERTKHIDVRYHFIRDVIAQEQVIVKKIATAVNPADMLTKPLAVAKFTTFVDLVGLQKP